MYEQWWGDGLKAFPVAKNDRALESYQQKAQAAQLSVVNFVLPTDNSRVLAWRNGAADVRRGRRWTPQYAAD